MRIVLPYVACLTPVYAYSSATSSASLNLSAAAKYCTSRQCAHQAARHHFQWEATYLKFLKGLHLLKHAYALSDEEVVQRWVQNPYDQYFCGEEFFSVSSIRETKRNIQRQLPIDPSQMTRWRKRMGESGCERLLKLTIDAGKRTKTITERSVEKVIVDTTVQPKAMAHPTDGRLYLKIHGP